MAIGEISIETYRKCFHWESGQTLNQVAHAHCGISILEAISNLTGQATVIAPHTGEEKFVQFGEEENTV